MSRNWLAIRIWFLVIVFAVSLAGAPAFAQGAATVRVDPSTLSVQANAVANMAIRVDNISNLIAFEIHLSFDPNVLEVTSVTNGGFVAADIAVQNTFDNAAGTIDYAVAQMNRPPAQGSGALLNIAFRAKAIGVSTVTTRATPAAPSGLILADQNGNEIPASWTPGTVNVGTSTPVANTPTNTPTPDINVPTNTPSPTGAPVQTQGATVVRVDPATSSTQVNNTVKICIKVDNVANLVAFELHLSFDPKALAVEPNGITNGGLVAADIDFGEKNKYDNAAGAIDYAAAQINRPPAQGSGTLLCIVFRAKAIGVSTVTTRATPAAPRGLILADQNGNEIPASWVPGTINIVERPGNTHIVRWGEWLYCIGRAYKVSPWEIARASGIGWPYMIFPNQRLTIPDVPWTNMTPGPVCKAQFTISTPTPIPPTPNPVPPTVTPTLTPAPGVTTSPSACRATHVVRSGETLYRIALRYGTTYTEIARVNGISNPRLIYPGQQLCIP